MTSGTISPLYGDASATAPEWSDIDRRLTLDWPVRTYFATSLAQRVGPRVAGAPYGMHPEYLLEGVVVAKQARG